MTERKSVIAQLSPELSQQLVTQFRERRVVDSFTAFIGSNICMYLYYLPESFRREDFGSDNPKYAIHEDDVDPTKKFIVSIAGWNSEKQPIAGDILAPLSLIILTTADYDEILAESRKNQ